MGYSQIPLVTEVELVRDFVIGRGPEDAGVIRRHDVAGVFFPVARSEPEEVYGDRLAGLYLASELYKIPRQSISSELARLLPDLSGKQPTIDRLAELTDIFTDVTKPETGEVVLYSLESRSNGWREAAPQFLHTDSGCNVRMLYYLGGGPKKAIGTVIGNRITKTPADGAGQISSLKNFADRLFIVPGGWVSLIKGAACSNAVWHSEPDGFLPITGRAVAIWDRVLR